MHDVFQELEKPMNWFKVAVTLVDEGTMGGKCNLFLSSGWFGLDVGEFLCEVGSWKVQSHRVLGRQGCCS